MARHAKLFIAVLATTLAATLGTASVAASADAGKVISYRDGNWCC